MDQLNAVLWAGWNGLPPTPNTLHLGCSYQLHSSHCFLSIWSAVRLEKVKLKAIQVEILENVPKMDCQLATYRHKIAQVFQLGKEVGYPSLLRWCNSIYKITQDDARIVNLWACRNLLRSHSSRWEVQAPLPAILLFFTWCSCARPSLILLFSEDYVAWCSVLIRVGLGHWSYFETSVFICFFLPYAETIHLLKNSKELNDRW